MESVTMSVCQQSAYTLSVVIPALGPFKLLSAFPRASSMHMQLQPMSGALLD